MYGVSAAEWMNLRIILCCFYVSEWVASEFLMLHHIYIVDVDVDAERRSYQLTSVEEVHAIILVGYHIDSLLKHVYRLSTSTTSAQYSRSITSVRVLTSVWTVRLQLRGWNCWISLAAESTSRMIASLYSAAHWSASSLKLASRSPTWKRFVHHRICFTSSAYLTSIHPQQWWYWKC